ncbi:MAG: molybdopterin-guanine dinucleotide biosynthesis protein MobB, partial [Anaerolineae bacterium]|nr:molybdopterin-guanine dinucleotide biosynthesis protein MobB [Anaerolineae bacterium]
AHTALITPDRVVHTRRHTEPPALEVVLAEISDVDLIILEGYKSGPYPKIEVVRLERDPNLIPGLEGRIACVTDVPCLPCDVPCFGLNEIAAIGDFIESVIMGNTGATLYAEVLDGTLDRD